MRSEEFIRQCVTGQRTKEGRVASVYFDGKHIYSYGTHYPLLIKFNERWILNDRGYSATTGKHISWARSYADYTLSLKGSSVSRSNLIDSVESEINYVQSKIKQLSKRAFRQKENLESRLKALKLTEAFLKTSDYDNDEEIENSEENFLNTVGAIAQLGEVFCDKQEEKNAWKKRMLNAGLKNKGLQFPDDWDELDEDTKQARLDGAIKQITK